MPAGLLASRPFTVDGYNGEGLCVAFGLWAAIQAGAQLNMSLMPKTSSRHSERSHAVEARPELPPSSKTRLHGRLDLNKVMRSYYARAIEEQFGTLPEDFRNVATEISLIFLDIREKPLRTWLRLKLDQQSMDVNKRMSCHPTPAEKRPKATPAQLQTLYRASYTSMVLSLNYFTPDETTSSTRTNMGLPVRPDLICFSLLWLADHTVRLDPTIGQYAKGPGVSAPEWRGEN